ncbi:MAG: hypothetical protein IJW70_11760 [Clostridia bacterium]|nr:hypothetical protein [Clostridia bacterium]
MKKLHNHIRIICTVLLCLMLTSALCGCARILRGEEYIVYPCYFNQDVEGVDGKAIRDLLDKEGWVRVQPESDEDEDKPLYENSKIYSYHTGEEQADQRRLIIIHEFENAEQAEAVYLENLTLTVFAGEFPLDHSMYQMELRISNCVIMTIRNAHVMLFDMLDLGEIRSLQAFENVTHQSIKSPKSVDIEAVRAKMEADGYQFHPSVMYEEGEENYSNTYIIVSPEQDRAYAFTQGQRLQNGRSNTYLSVDLVCDIEKVLVGMHVVDFKDGSSIICYGESFEEIREYFEE